ncbi:DMT family transporter [Mesorhizobium sp. CGMCC 1.15528]|uniref:DMT family transporter n=1 Tax=Mesorhizobium zhangyense TaxID=1776730 RepID=A0A7C9R715_9HYPH|nr:DMT family transporter [Mesorhizobium zhangyense]NGN41714.1 DMT family transporter [Mesorhizobium zhangyense]
MSSGKAGSAMPGPVEYALLAGVSLTWGTSYMFTKIAVGTLQPFTLIACRCFVAAIALLLIVAFRRSFKRLAWRDLAAFALVGLMSNAAPLSLIAISVSHVNSSVTATTLALVPLITAMLAVFGGDRPKPRNIAGILVGLVGIVLLFGPDALLHASESARGAIAAVGAALVFSSALFVMAIVRHHHPLTVTVGSLTAAALWMIPTALIVDGIPPAWPSIGVTGAVLVLGLLNTALSSLMLFALVPRAGATFTSYNNYLVPVIAVLCGTVFLGEPMTAQSALGVIVVLAGVAISTIRRLARPERLLHP